MNHHSALCLDLSSWFKVQGSTIVAYVDQQAVSHQQLQSQVSILAAQLRALPEHRWAIWQDCSYQFLVAFLALAHAGKHILLPGNLQSGVAAEIASDIVESGIVVTGGGALLKRIDILISQATGLAVRIAEEPLNCVVKGIGVVVHDIEKYKHVTFREE